MLPNSIYIYIYIYIVNYSLNYHHHVEIFIYVSIRLIGVHIYKQIWRLWGWEIEAEKVINERDERMKIRRLLIELGTEGEVVNSRPSGFMCNYQ